MKSGRHVAIELGQIVAPFTGAWIEIAQTEADYFIANVAPFTGAWIEIRDWPKLAHLEGCRSLHGSVD